VTLTEPRSDPSAQAQALFQEARECTRRRRRRRATVGCGLAALLYAILSTGDARSAGSAPAGPAVDRAAFAGHGRLAFVSQGRLYVLDGARLRAVSAAGETASRPQFSPDGRHLAYRAGGAEYLARADGTGARRVGSAAVAQSWLPDGELVAAGAPWRVGASGFPRRVGPLPPGLTAWSPSGAAFVFVQSTVRRSRGGRWRESWRLEVARSLRGPRTTWYERHVSFAPATGTSGEVLGGVAVLPRHAGILFTLDPGGSSSVAADGLATYLIGAPSEAPRSLGTTVGLSVSPGGAGTFALTTGPDRYATLTKRVEVCSVRPAACRATPTAAGRVSFDPAFSPDGRTLAYITAPSTFQGDFEQRNVVAWYASHTLWTLGPGGKAHRIAGTTGASRPIWSADGRSLLYTAHDALHLVAADGRTRPVRIAGPLFDPAHWPAAYFRVDWRDQFAWWSR